MQIHIHVSSIKQQLIILMQSSDFGSRLFYQRKVPTLGFRCIVTQRVPTLGNMQMLFQCSTSGLACNKMYVLILKQTTANKL